MTTKLEGGGVMALVFGPLKKSFFAATLKEEEKDIFFC